MSADILKGHGVVSDEIYDPKYIVTERQLQDMVTNLRCSHSNCKSKVETIVVPHHLDNRIIVKCKRCEEVCDSYPNTYGEKSSACHKFTEINIEDIYHSINQGTGQSGLL